MIFVDIDVDIWCIYEDWYVVVVVCDFDVLMLLYVDDVVFEILFVVVMLFVYGFGVLYGKVVIGVFFVVGLCNLDNLFGCWY